MLSKSLYKKLSAKRKKILGTRVSKTKQNGTPTDTPDFQNLRILSKTKELGGPGGI